MPILSARYVALGAMLAALACARNTENPETGTTRSDTLSTPTDTIRVRADTGRMRADTGMRADTAGRQIYGDTTRGTETRWDSTAGGGAPVRAGTSDSARMGNPDTTRMQRDTAQVTVPPTPPARTDTSRAAWPSDTTRSTGWPSDTSRSSSPRDSS